MKVGKTIRNSLNVAGLILGLAVVGQAQTSTPTPAPTVSVSQEYLNSSKRSFEEVVLLRAAVAAQQKAMEAMEERDAAKDQLTGLQKILIDKQADELAAKDKQLEIYKKMTCDTSTFLFIFKKKRCK
jgi:hypothetical protein